MRSITSPYHLPQISMPTDLILKKIDEEGVDYDYIRVNPKDLNPLQAFTLSDEVEKAVPDDNNPIWLDKDMNILDGHKRMVYALTDNLQLTAVQIDMNAKDACRLLNKIQDIYEYEQQQQLEEVEAQDAINANNERNGGVSYSEFLKSLEENNAIAQSEKPSKNDKQIIAYRRDPIKENSVIGNFFTLKPVEGFDKFQIDFENLLDTNDLGVEYKDSQVPSDILAKIWFPNINFEKLSEQYKIPSLNLKNKAIAEKAQRMGYDGIKYGDTLIQGLK
jgi:hypothetical protein